MTAFTKTSLVFGFAGLLLASNAALATPVTLGEAGFGASDTLINFNTIANEQAVGSQYASSGVVFSGALLGMTNEGDIRLFPSNGGGGIASNWNYTAGQYVGLSFTASFSSKVTRVGFLLENWPSQTLTMEFFDGATSRGTITTTTSTLDFAEFKGFEETAGFNRIVFTNTANENGFFAIDDFRFAAAVPEPETYAMMMAGLGFLGLRRRKQK